MALFCKCDCGELAYGSSCSCGKWFCLPHMKKHLIESYHAPPLYFWRDQEVRRDPR